MDCCVKPVHELLEGLCENWILTLLTHLCNILRFYGSKNDNFKMKTCDIFLVSLQNIQAIITSTYNLVCFDVRIRKIMCIPVNPAFIT